MGPHPLTLPTAEHPHSEARSITGGVVYYGLKWSELRGHYIYGDYGTGKIWSIKHDGEKQLALQEIADTQLAITGFADPFDDCWSSTTRAVFIDWNATRTRPAAPFPQRLSETGLFVDTKTHEMHPGVLGYSVMPGWNDGATTERWMAVPVRKK